MNPQPKPVPRPKKARKPLQRSRMKRGLPRRVTRPGSGSDPAYLEKVRGLRCCAPISGWCFGDVVAHHAGPKTNDSTATPLCVAHHDAWHGAYAVFKNWDKETRREWAVQAIAATRRELGWVAAPRGGR